MQLGTPVCSALLLGLLASGVHKRQRLAAGVAWPTAWLKVVLTARLQLGEAVLRSQKVIDFLWLGGGE